MGPRSSGSRLTRPQARRGRRCGPVAARPLGDRLVVVPNDVVQAGSPWRLRVVLRLARRRLLASASRKTPRLHTTVAAIKDQLDVSRATRAWESNVTERHGL